MMKTVLPRSKIEVQMPPGAAMPASGIYEQSGSRGGRAIGGGSPSSGRIMAPTGKSGKVWTLVKAKSE